MFISLWILIPIALLLVVLMLDHGTKNRAIDALEAVNNKLVNHINYGDEI